MAGTGCDEATAFPLIKVKWPLLGNPSKNMQDNKDRACQQSLPEGNFLERDKLGAQNWQLKKLKSNVIFTALWRKST